MNSNEREQLELHARRSHYAIYKKIKTRNSPYDIYRKANYYNFVNIHAFIQSQDEPNGFKLTKEQRNQAANLQWKQITCKDNKDKKNETIDAFYEKGIALMKKDSVHLTGSGPNKKMTAFLTNKAQVILD